jgi:hypothetical protein
MKYIVEDRFIDKVEALIKAVEDCYSSRLNPVDRARWFKAHAIAREIKLDIEDGFEEAERSDENDE